MEINVKKKPERLLTFLPGADEAVFFVTAVIVPPAGHQVVVTYGHAVFLLKTRRKLEVI